MERRFAKMNYNKKEVEDIETKISDLEQDLRKCSEIDLVCDICGKRLRELPTMYHVKEDYFLFNWEDSEETTEEQDLCPDCLSKYVTQEKILSIANANKSDSGTPELTAIHISLAQ